MASLRFILRFVVSIVGSLVPLLFLSGYPLFGNSLPNIFGSQGSLGGLIGDSSIAQLLPIGTAGLTGLVVWGVLQRVLSQVQMAAYSSPKIDSSEMMRSMQGAMPWMGAQQASNVLQTLPSDLTKSQYMVLRMCRQGHSKSKEIAKQLSMDKNEVEREITSLQANGYLTRANKLTGKSMNVVGN